MYVQVTHFSQEKQIESFASNHGVYSSCISHLGSNPWLNIDVSAVDQSFNELLLCDLYSAISHGTDLFQTQ